MNDGVMEVVGLAPISTVLPTFATPIFSDRVSNRLYYQILDKNLSVVGFEKFSERLAAHLSPYYGQEKLRIGDEAVFGFLNGGDQSYLGTKSQIAKQLRPLLSSLTAIPVIQFQVAQFCGDAKYKTIADQNMVALFDAAAGDSVRPLPDFPASIIQTSGYQLVREPLQNTRMPTYPGIHLGPDQQFSAQRFLDYFFEQEHYGQHPFTDGSHRALVISLTVESAQRKTADHLAEWFLSSATSGSVSMRYHVVKLEVRGFFHEVNLGAKDFLDHDWSYSQSLSLDIRNKGADGFRYTVNRENNAESGMCVFNKHCIFEAASIGRVEISFAAGDLPSQAKFSEL